MKGRFLAVLLLAALLSGCGRKAPVEPAAPSAPPASAAPRPSFTGAAASGAGRDEVFTLNYSAGESLNPFTCRSETNRLLCNLMFETLVAVKPDFTAAPKLFSEWSCEDGLHYYFTVRDGVTFSDGTPFGAGDALSSLERARKNDSVYAGRFRNVLTMGVQEGRVVIVLREANPSFPLLLDIPVAKAGSAWEDRPIGTGPYVFTETEEYRCLQAYKDYRDFEALPLYRFYLAEYTPEEVGAAFGGGFLDLLTADTGVYGRFNMGGNAERRMVSTTQLYYLGVNTASPSLEEPARRRLVSAALDRSAVASAVGGEITRLPISPSSPLYDEDAVAPWRPASLADYCVEILTEDYDGDGALEYIRAGTVTEMTLDLIFCEENPVSVAAAEAVAAGLNEQGVTTVPRGLSESAFLRALWSNDYDLYLASIRLTADFDLTDLFCSGGSAHFGYWDWELEQYTAAFRTAPAAERKKAAAELSAYLAENCPLIPLAFARRAVITQRGVVQGMIPTWTDPFYNLGDWKVYLGE